MTCPSRRTVLCSTAVVVGLSAGCLADEETLSDDDDETTDGDDGSQTDGTKNDSEAIGDAIEDLPDGLADGRTLPYQFPASTEPDIEVLQDADSATNWLEERASLRDADAVSTFIDKTDFETSMLVSLSAETPTPCYEVVLESIGIESSDGGDDSSHSGADETTGEEGDGEDTLVLEAAVNETDDSEACAQVITTVGRLVRVTFESEPLTTISATLVDHDGSTYDVTMGSDSGSASASKRIGSDESASTNQTTDS